MRITAHNLYQRDVVSFMGCGFKVADGHNGLFCSRNLTFNRLSKSVMCRFTDTEFCLHTHVALSFQLSVNGILRLFGSLCMNSKKRYITVSKRNIACICAFVCSRFVCNNISNFSHTITVSGCDRWSSILNFRVLSY